jgi:hypothetical protein
MKETADAGPENASKIAGIEKSMMRSLPSLGKILIKVDSLRREPPPVPRK